MLLRELTQSCPARILKDTPFTAYFSVPGYVKDTFLYLTSFHDTSEECNVQT